MKTKSFSVSIKRADWLNATGLLKKLCKAKRGEEAVLSFDGACLHIECGGMEVAPGASGDWPVQVRIDYHFLKMLAAVPPAEETVIFSVENNTLMSGSLTIPCKVQQAWSKMIDLPMNATELQILSLAFKHSPEEVQESGYGRVVSNAIEKLNERIAKAAEHLRNYPITQEELREFVHNIIRKKAAAGEI